MMLLDWFLDEFPRNLSSNKKKTYFLKLELLSKGLRVNLDLNSFQHKEPLRVRTGASGGLDLSLSHDVFVNAPVNESFAKNSDLILKKTNNRFIITSDLLEPFEVTLFSEPNFYKKRTSTEISMRQIGQMCTGDRLCIGLENKCYFWSTGEQCQFCSIELNRNEETYPKIVSDICEVIGEAEKETKHPMCHIDFTSGTFPPPDHGAVYYSSIIKKVKEITDKRIYVMICPPFDLKYVDCLYDAGVYEIGYNIEIFDKKIAKEIIPGKANRIGFDQYTKTLKRAVDLYGEIKTKSALLVGLESKETTLKGVDFLCQLGVMPVLSCFRPLSGTRLERQRPPSTYQMAETFFESLEIADSYGMPLGPTCIPCQNNSLAFPLPGEKYVYY